MRPRSSTSPVLEFASALQPAKKEAVKMPPKKKGNKKASDDWEAELGESAAPASAAPEAPNGAGDDEASAGGGGLMAVMRKNKEKRKKKGLAEDFVDGESPSNDTASAEPAPQLDLASKAAEEATMEDEFALPEKSKGAKGKQQPVKEAPAKGDDEAADDDEDGGRVLTKAEKEKLKREREKQRKKEQVSVLNPR